MKAVSLLLVFFLCIQPVTAATLAELVQKVGKTDLSTLKQELENLPWEDKAKLQILLFLYSRKEKEAEELLEELSRGKELISNIIALPDDTFAVVVDKEKEILYTVAFYKGTPVVTGKFPCITGKRPGDKLKEGDRRTPEGIYFPLAWNANLPSTYGIGAFPLNYPNLLDREILTRDGHGIWIHGTNDPNRPPHSSNGCIVLQNQYLRLVKSLIKPKKTPVVIVSKLSTSTKEAFIKERKSILDFIYRWKRAWENTIHDIDDYFECYSNRFVWKKGGINEWKQYKIKVTKQKRWIDIDVSNIVIARDGRVLSFGNLYVVNLDLYYRSNNFKSKDRKVLYIVKEGGTWKILGEENL
jgi:murein L,D-transpeptidase YafK